MSNDNVLILLCNLGTPSELSERAIRHYLKEMLSDPALINQSIFWKALLNFFILPLCSKKTADKYRAIWTKQGSPLLNNMQKTALKIQEKLRGDNDNIKIETAMLYGELKVSNFLKEEYLKKYDKIVVFPLFPQKSKCISGNLKQIILSEKISKPLIIFNEYYQNSAYINALTKTIEKHLNNFNPQALLLSYHALPRKDVNEYTTYTEQCLATTAALKNQITAKNLNIIHSYQSKYGCGTWSGPDTSTCIKQAAGQGIERLAVACPGFATDCLETLYEVNKEYREIFIKNGGKEFCYIPCLNAEEIWIDALSKILKSAL